MTKSELMTLILPQPSYLPAPEETASCFAPSNIALVKYWGKRSLELNLPVTSSLSVGLGDKGARIRLQRRETEDQLQCNGIIVPEHSVFFKKIHHYLTLFRPHTTCFYQIDIQLNLPLAAGFASSACLFAALIQALNQLHQWQLSKTDLSVLARLGSGSACRSLWSGFVRWEKGEEENGLDSHGIPLNETWPELAIGLIKVNTDIKPISSSEAMILSQQSSSLYRHWPTLVDQALIDTQEAITQKDFSRLGIVAQRNSEHMHAILHTTFPPINYNLPATQAYKNQIISWQQAGHLIYFTQDAGPNLKLLTRADEVGFLVQELGDLEIIYPFQEKTVILVNERDEVIGKSSKKKAHEEALLHRAFSVFIMRRRSDGELECLLQKRCTDKYHSGGLWTNTCCSHPSPEEDTHQAAVKRLQEEMGIQTHLSYAGAFHYRADFENGLVEHEYDHVFVGTYSGEPHPNLQEVADYRWVRLTPLQDWLSAAPEQFTPWFRPGLDIALQKVNGDSSSDL